MTIPFKPCKFTFDPWDADWPVFEGYEHGSFWNGFDNVLVTPEVRDQIVAFFKPLEGDDYDDGMEHIEPGPDGLISLGWGYTTTIVDGENDR